MKEEHGIEKVLKSVYNVGKAMGMSSTEGRRYVGAYNSSIHMTNIGPLRDAVKYVRKLHSDHGYKLHVITSQTSDKSAREFRKYNLETLFGKGIFHGITILDAGADKDKVLEKWKDSGCYWVEDKLQNADIGKKLGLNSIVMAHDHNVNTKHVRAQNWKEIYNIITGE
jgi:FMN phosphatase YigB (HAD superfamily)